MKKTLIAVVPLLLLATGCLTGEREHTLYIESDGTVTWTVSEELVRSTDSDPGNRRRENAAYPAAVERGEHQVGLALSALRPFHVESDLLRDRVPFASRTTARFHDLAAVYQGLMDASGLPGRAWMERDGSRSRLVIEFPLDEGGEPVENEDPSTEVDLLPLVENYTGWRLVLADGRFTGGRGFSLQGSQAAPADPEDLDSPEGAKYQTLFLEWEPRED